VIALRGELGSGKTTFARGLARGLGFAGRVASPTYTLCASYECGAGRVLHHFDAYLGEKERAFLLEGGAELLGGQGIAGRDAVSVVEWPERIEDCLPADRLEIEFAEGPDADDRILAFHGTGARGARLAQQILEAAMPTFGKARSLGSAEVALA
jgi:tRNA threonylcarbamoyladenosine biosynthesis protein TsaE